jgi:acyl carrier protein
MSAAAPAERDDPALAARVAAIVAEALGRPAADVRLESNLMDDLGAESLDFLDLVFRLETEYGVKIPRDGIRLAAQEGLADGFEKGGVLTDEALERMRILMPEVPAAKLATGLRTHQIPELFTMESFVRLVAWRLAETSKV